MAAEWAQQYVVDDELSYLREVEHIALARALIALGKSEEAVDWLVRLW